MAATTTSTPPRKNRTLDLCKHCGAPVNLADEGSTYRDGTCAHEHCADEHTFQHDNRLDFGE